MLVTHGSWGPLPPALLQNLAYPVESLTAHALKYPCHSSCPLSPPCLFCSCVLLCRLTPLSSVKDAWPFAEVGRAVVTGVAGCCLCDGLQYGGAGVDAAMSASVWLVVPSAVAQAWPANTLSGLCLDFAKLSLHSWMTGLAALAVVVW